MSNKFSEKIIDNITKCLKCYANNNELTRIYKWPINTALDELDKIKPNVSASARKLGSVFEKTIEARRIVRGKLKSELSSEEKKSYILWIIKIWGGIGAIDGKKIITSINEKEECRKNGKECFDFKNIASWSKYFSFKYPDKYAIYDARVIYSLNWLLLQSGGNEFFPTPEGRNSLMNAFDYTMLLFIKKIGDQEIKETINSDIDNRAPGANSRAINTLERKCYIEKDAAYTKYCTLLKKIAQELFPHDEHRLIMTEMILFAIADKDIVKEVMNCMLSGYACYFSPEKSIQNLTDSCRQNTEESSLLQAVSVLEEASDHLVSNTAPENTYNQYNEEDEMAEVENNEIDAFDGVVVFGGITVSSVDINTVYARISNITQAQFEQDLQDLLQWLFENGVRKIVFQSGGALVLPDWFINSLRDAGIVLEFAEFPFQQDANHNWLLWGQEFIGGKVPQNHNFTQSISFYHEFRIENPGNTRNVDFRNWLINTHHFALGGATPITFPLGPNQLRILALSDAEVRLLATDPTGIYARRFLGPWRRCNVYETLPRCLADVYIAGRVAQQGLNTAQIIALGFAGTAQATGAILRVGNTMGQHFGFLDAANNPTAFFRYYFG